MEATPRQRVVLVGLKKPNAKQAIEAQCRRFTPLIDIAGRDVPGTFDKVVISPVSGRVVAYYTARTYVYGIVRTARYRVHGNGFTLEHCFPLRREA